jgi:hypothetical protein
LSQKTNQTPTNQAKIVEKDSKSKGSFELKSLLIGRPRMREDYLLSGSLAIQSSEVSVEGKE